VPPGAFLPAAERFNLMPAIDRWVIRAALKWLTANDSLLKSLDMCSINLSGITLCDQNFTQYVLDEIESRQIPPQKICFEITETAAIASFNTATSFINTMRQHGYRFALDDFGSGLSSFGYLKDLPVDYLKIDGSFVIDLDTNPVHQAIVTSINQIGHVMKLKTIAEHVENDAVREVLKNIGVDYVQGYGIAKPELLPRG
jgi:EAL domain-containing protein (putative c-di-GMP-specific phosphodiesterase class I)